MDPIFTLAYKQEVPMIEFFIREHCSEACLRNWIGEAPVLESFLVYYAKLGFIGLQKNYYNRIIAMAMARPIRQLSEGTESRIAFNVDGKIFWVEAAINHGGNLGLLFQFGIHAFKRKYIETEKVAWYSMKRKRVFYRHYAPTSAQP